MLNLYCKGIAAFYAGISMLAGTGTGAAGTLDAAAIQPEALDGVKALSAKGILYIMIPLLLLIIIIFASEIHRHIYAWFSRMMTVLKGFLTIMGINTGTGVDELNEALEIAGYSYDSRQDIFYSIIDPWQRNFGYCRLYDEAAAPLGMIVDCEPVYFEYDGKKWLIEFWKGQYDLTTGCEIGIYTTKGPDLNIPGVFNGTFYNCGTDEEFLHMSYSLKKNGKTLFTRRGRHWWLTGFKLGEFSEPSELRMNINITLKDKAMHAAFVKGLKEAGYSDNEMIKYGKTVSLIFDKARTPQPVTRTDATDRIMQMKNKLLCDKYQEITRGCTTILDKIEAVREKAPEMYGSIIGLGKPKQLYSIYETLKDYLD